MRRSNSVDSLSPKSRFLNAMNTIPMAPGVPYNTIIGDRGRGDSPNSSDGVVPYWSSHLNGAESEDIVPSGHGAHQNPQAIAEVLRILKTNARQYATHTDHFRESGTTDRCAGCSSNWRTVRVRYGPLLIKLFPTPEIRPASAAGAERGLPKRQNYVVEIERGKSYGRIRSVASCFRRR
jgi:hypothetical protein